MQLFGLDTCPEKAAAQLANVHVNSQVRESTQLLFSALHAWGVPLPATIDAGDRGVVAVYRPTHVHHPLTLWTQAARAHANWVLRHALALAALYTTKSGGKVHLCEWHLRAWKRIVDANDVAHVPETVDPEAWLASLEAPKRDALRSRVATVHPPEGCAFGIVALAVVGPMRADACDWTSTYREAYEVKSLALNFQFGAFAAASRKRARESR